MCKLKNTTKVKKLPRCTQYQFYIAEERIYKLQENLLEIIQFENQGGKDWRKVNKTSKICGTISNSSTYI